LDIHEALWVVALLGFSDTDLFATMARSTRRQNMPKNHFLQPDVRLRHHRESTQK
jgi:hypothetical protein